MSSPFTDLQSLAEHLRALVQKPAPVELDSSILDPTVANDISQAFVLGDAALTIDGLSAANIPDPANNQLIISAGNASVLGQDARPVALTFSIENNALQIVVLSTMPNGWKFVDSFDSLSIFPFDSLTVANGASFVFSSMAQPSYTWPGGGAAIELAAGQNFLGEVGLGGFSLIASLLGSLLDNKNYPLYGSFSPVTGQALPVASLTAPIATGSFSIGNGTNLLSLIGPVVAVIIGTSDDDTNPLQQVSLQLQGVFQNSLQVTVEIPVSGSNYSITTTPLPNSPSIVSLIEALPGGADFTSYIPSELSSIFAAVGLNYFTMVVDSTPAVTYLGMEISTLQPWSVISSVIELEGLQLVIDVVDPTGSDLIQARIDAQAQFFPKIFTGEFDFVVELEQDNETWEVSTVSGAYFGAVNLGDLVAGLLGNANSVPQALRDISFSNFGVSATRDSQGAPFTYTAYGSASASFPLLNSQLSAGLNVVFTKTDTSYDVQLSGALAIGAQGFDITLDVGTAGSKLEASWTDAGDPLEFADVASAFGWNDMPAIPSSLDLSLVGASFIYDFTSGNLIFGAQSKNYGSLVFSAISVSGAYEYFLLLGVDQQFSLSNLPLVGAQLAQIENIEVGGIGIILCSTIPDTTTVSTINTLIGQLPTAGGVSYPTFPDTPLTGPFVLQAQLTFGTQSIPLNLELGGRSSSQAALPAPDAVSIDALTIDARETTALTTTHLRSAVAASSSTPTTTWFNVQKSFGPVSFQRIGAMYQSDQQVLWFQLDASLAFGPITMDLIGLGLGSPLTSFEPQFSLQGLGISYSSPPLTIAGSLTNLAPPGADYIEFEGGVTIGTGDFTVLAFGYYGNQGDFSSMFIFGDIAYDFGGPPAFFVTGIALGFGYNSNLRIPTIDEVASFPFVEVLPTSMTPNTGVFGPNPTPQSVLDVIMNTSPAWVSPQQGSLWFAAGITFTSFEMVNSQALILVQFGRDLVIALVGTSRAQFPQGAGSGTPVYAYIELDLLVELSPSQGVFSVQALLAQSSFLLDKACMLTGGFAFFVWYGPNPHAGDFVLTLGGYNPGFTPPSYYPTVPAVGFHWSLDSSISVTGGAYFAFTPSVLMVGGELNVTYQSGNLKAWFDAHADIIVQWNPFWFDAAFGISIGASYKVDLWFTSFTVTAELGCNLEVWGPPTGGSVGVDWYIISFSIPFGASRNSSKPVINQWSQVQAMLPNSGSTTAPNVITLSPASGLTPTATKPPNSGNVAARATADVAAPPAPWIVRGSQFSFNTSSSIPASTAKVGDAHQIQGNQFNVAPLGWTGMAAEHAITIVDKGNNDVSSAFSVTPSFGNVPQQLWGSQSTSTPDSSAQLVPNQLVGLSVVVNPPEIGGSAGAVNVAVNLASINLDIKGALIGLAASANPAGDIAVNSSTTLAVIVDPNSGIDSPATRAARNAIFSALGTLQYAPATKNDRLTNFASQAGGSFSAVPLLVA
ncbi:MAG: DUF6603 domain-containing protein [Terracidiphilus sp.]|jgi:hypothetical protein